MTTSVSIEGNPYVHNKKGILKPDNNGYYRMVAGAFGIRNRSGILYPMNQKILKMPTIGSTGALFLKDKALFAENGHPVREAHMKQDEQYFARLRQIRESLHYAHIRKVEFLPGRSHTGEECHLAYIEFKPKGSWKQDLIEALKNPDENVCWSLRSICTGFGRIPGMVETKVVDDWITYDRVTLGGMKDSDKNAAPGLECIDLISDFTSETLEAAEYLVRENSEDVAGLECIAESFDIVRTNLGWQKVKRTDVLTNAYRGWAK